MSSLTSRLIVVVLLILEVRSKGDDDAFEQFKEELSVKAHLTDAEQRDFFELLHRLNDIEQEKVFGAVDVKSEWPTLMSVDHNRTLDELSEISPDLFEGDILLTPKQMRTMERLVAKGDQLDRVKRKIHSNKSFRWPGNVIRYSITTGPRQAVKAGLKQWQSQTCLKFREIRAGSKVNHLEFYKGVGCTSMVGRDPRGGAQPISIGKGCQTRSTTVAHEIGHALGLWHEQSRSDRDRHVRIRKRQVRQSALFNFLEYPTDSVDIRQVPYDLGSAMHYSSKCMDRPFYMQSFSKNGRITIETVEPLYRMTIGQRDQLSFYDVKAINLAYCRQTCSSRGLNCQNGGYADPANCAVCRCPIGLDGRKCGVAAGGGGCGAPNLRATSTWQTLRPRAKASDCAWMIKTDRAGQRIRLRVQTRGFNCDKDTCYQEYLEVKAAKDLANTGPRICSNMAFSLTSRSNMVVLIFKKMRGTFTVKYRLDGSGAIPAKARAKAAQRTPLTPWSSWSPCTKACGGCGVRLRRRRCKLKPKSRCGQTPVEQRKTCNSQTCPLVRRANSKKFCQVQVTYPHALQGSTAGGVQSWPSCNVDPGSVKRCCGGYYAKAGKCLKGKATTVAANRRVRKPPPPAKKQTGRRSPLKQANRKKTVQVQSRRVASSSSNWSQWSFCSFSCGGCGVRTRKRKCPNGKCSGKSRSDIGRCLANSKACRIEKIGANYCRSGYMTGHALANAKKGKHVGPCKQRRENISGCCAPFVKKNGRCVRN